MAERYGVRTVYGNYNFVSTVKNRSAWLTVYLGSSKVLQRQSTQKQQEILRDAPKTVELVHGYVKKAPLTCVERTMGDNPYFIVKEFAEWKPEPHFGTLMLKRANGVDVAKFDLCNFYSEGQVDVLVGKLKKERSDWLRRFQNLSLHVLNAA
ncbi:MAG: hypothetical protein ACLFU9_03555, partial [Candidatus Bathyarchaeia archaeon]